MRATFSWLFVMFVYGLKSQTVNIQELEVKALNLIQNNDHLIPSFVMMTFHDCADKCNGCINMNAKGNRGLPEVYSLAKNFHIGNRKSLSLADTVALLGKTASEVAIRKSDGVTFLTNQPFRTGRKTCRDPIRPPRREGLPHGKITNTIPFLMEKFDLTTKEAVALIGCHSIGSLHPFILGFNGKWDSSEDKLDNSYYKGLSNPGWTVVKVENNKERSSCQWVKEFKGKNFTMLNADMTIWRQFNTTGRHDEPDCTYDTCPEADTASYVRKFAEDQADFHQTLMVAFNKMIDSGLRK